MESNRSKTGREEECYFMLGIPEGLSEAFTKAGMKEGIKPKQGQVPWVRSKLVVGLRSGAPAAGWEEDLFGVIY